MTGVINNPILLDASQTAIENIFNLISAANLSTPVTPDLVTLGTPAVWNASDDTWRNSQVVATALPRSPWYGTQLLKYHRIDISTELGIDISIDQNASTTIAGILTALVNKIKLIPGQVKFDVTSIPTPNPGDDSVTVNLQAIVGSLAYIGSVPVKLTGFTASNVRRQQDGTIRLLMSGTTRLLDAA